MSNTPLPIGAAAGLPTPLTAEPSAPVQATPFNAPAPAPASPDLFDGLRHVVHESAPAPTSSDQGPFSDLRHATLQQAHNQTAGIINNAQTTDEQIAATKPKPSNVTDVPRKFVGKQIGKLSDAIVNRAGNLPSGVKQDVKAAVDFGLGAYGLPVGADQDAALQAGSPLPFEPGEEGLAGLREEPTAPLPHHDDLADAITERTKDPALADKRARELLAAARGDKGYTGVERRAANVLIDSYVGPERRTLPVSVTAEPTPAAVDPNSITLKPNAPLPQIKTQAADIAKNLGIESRGIQEGIPGAHPGLAIFQDPVSGTSIGVRLNEFSPEQVEKQLTIARDRIAEKPPTPLVSTPPEKKPFVGTHYSPVEAQNDTLLGADRGKAKAGAEQRRLQHDNAVPAVNVYREGVNPEPQIGARPNKYAVTGDKAIADIGGNERLLWESSYKDALEKHKANGENDTIAHEKALNDSEAALRDAGYDGYENQHVNKGAAVLFGDQKVGTPEAPALKPAAMAQNYADEHGLGHVDTAPVEEDPRSAEIAKAYDKLEHDPTNPAVKKSYDALKRDIDSQYDYAVAHGAKFDVSPEDPYKSAEELHRDVQDNNHLTVWSGGTPLAEDHPLAEIAPEGMSYNSKLRLVHDYFGHNGGDVANDFSAGGEESAWNLHRQLFSPEALPALTNETKGQTAYTLSHGGEFPEQKAALLPPEFNTRPEGNWSAKVAERMKTESAGGIDPRTGMSDTKGHGLEIYPEGKQRFDHQPTPEDISKFAEKNKELFSKYPNLRVGWDKDPSLGWELNIGIATPSREGAVATARTLGQRSAFDISKGKEIPTGGNNERSEFANYPLEQRISDATGKTEMGPKGFESLPKHLYDDMEPDEREHFAGSKVRQQNLAKSYYNIKPSLEETTNSMNAGAMNAGWWQRFMDAFKAIGDPATQDKLEGLGPSHSEALKQWHSAVSGNKNVEDAANLAGHSYLDWLNEGRPTDRKSIDDIVAKNAAQPEGSEKKGNAAIHDTIVRGKVKNKGLDTTKLYNLVNSPEMQGKRPFGGAAFGNNPLAGTSSGAIKIPSMGATVAGKGNLNRLVLDAHGLDFYGQNGWNDTSYVAHSIHMRRAAEALGLKGGEGQEQQWGVVLGLKELLKQGMSPEEAAANITDDFILKKGKDYAEIIRNDPESNALFEEMKKYGLKGPEATNAELDRIIAQRPKPREATGVDTAKLAATARRIKEQISPSKIKTTGPKKQSAETENWLATMRANAASRALEK